MFVRPTLEERLEQDICGAKKHYKWEVCRNKPVEPGMRCKFHGGFSPYQAGRKREHRIETSGEKLKAGERYLPARPEVEGVERDSES